MKISLLALWGLHIGHLAVTISPWPLKTLLAAATLQHI